jgi:hypothetical protein
MEIISDKCTAVLATAATAVLLLAFSAMAAGTDTKTTTAAVTVNQFLSVTLSNSPVAFPTMDPGTGPTNATTGSGFPLTVTVDSVSNVNAKISTKAGAVSFSGPGTLAVSNMIWSPTINGVYTGYTTGDAQVCSGIAPGNNCNIYHKMSVPSGTTAGSYSIGITITATV